MADDAEDLDILHPEQTADIGGRSVTVREFGFIEGLRIEVRAKPILDALADSDGGPNAVFEALAAHPELTLELMAQASDQPAEWVASLGDEDGQTLMMLFVGANAGFFARRLWRRRQLTMAPESPTSTPGSSELDSDDARPTSDA